MKDDGSHLEAEHAADHGADAEHDDGGGHGHGHDPNEGVLVGTPPTPAWIWTVTLIALVTIAWCVWLAYRIG